MTETVNNKEKIDYVERKRNTLLNEKTKKILLKEK